jgi:hypothetical protein
MSCTPDRLQKHSPKKKLSYLSLRLLVQLLKLAVAALDLPRGIGGT